MSAFYVLEARYFPLIENSIVQDLNVRIESFDWVENINWVSEERKVVL